LCASLSIRADSREYSGQFVEPVDADLRRPERHARAVGWVEHPIREFATKVRTLIRVDARQLFAAPK